MFPESLVMDSGIIRLDLLLNRTGIFKSELKLFLIPLRHLVIIESGIPIAHI
jgi:hypothetical protein